MRALVTGSSGMLGSRLMELLLDDYELFGVDRRAPIEKPPYRFLSVDLSNIKAVRRSLAEIQPEIVFHLAAKTQVDDCELKPRDAYQANSLATKNLLLASRKFDPVFFYISTDYVFSGDKGIVYKPLDKRDPVSVYGKSKAEGERWVERLTKKGIIVRTAWLYGSGGPNFVDTILRLAGEQKELRIVGDQVGSPTRTSDLAQALLEMLKKIPILPKIPAGVFHYTGAGETSWFGFAKEILRLAGIKRPVRAITTEELNRPASRPQYSRLDMTTLERTWGIRPRKWKESLKSYLREQGIFKI